jgi:hypothetical protein
MQRFCFGALLLILATQEVCASSSWIRINQLGYLPHSRKIAVLVSKDSGLSVKEFCVRDLLMGRVVFRSRAPRPFGPYAAFAQSFRLDFSALTTEGGYVIECGGVVSHADFLADLRANYRAMEKHGIRKEDAPYFLPPFEWYNEKVVEWCAEAGLTLVNFTPGTLANADYTLPRGEGRYVSSDSILESILSRETNSPTGLRGFFLLTHIGSDPCRTDKFYNHLEKLVTILRERGYEFRRLGKPLRAR